MAENGGLAGRAEETTVGTLPFPTERASCNGLLWVLATIAVFLIVGDGELPFGERPSLEGVLLAGQVINGWANLGITYSLEARRKGFGTKLQKTPTGELPRTLESGSLTLENAVKRKFNIGEFTFYEVG